MASGRSWFQLSSSWTEAEAVGRAGCAGIRRQTHDGRGALVRHSLGVAGGRRCPQGYQERQECGYWKSCRVMITRASSGNLPYSAMIVKCTQALGFGY